ncbi:MAG: DUF418 domain-containing protein [Bryobacteraceae bacterium]
MMRPISLSERIRELDVLRGAALLGIIAANMRAFNSPQPTYMDHTLMWTGMPDRIAQVLIDLLVSGKFITLFGFLFGIGFAVQMDRAAVRGVAPRGFYLRRMTVLLSFGLLHMALLWWGDILAYYALTGYALLLFRKRSQKTLLIWAAALYAWPMLLFGAMLIAHAAGAQIPLPPKTTPEELQRVIAVFATGTYGQMFRERLNEMIFNVIGLVFICPRILAIFLFGMWTWRTGILRNLGEHRPILRACRKWGLVAGLALNGAMVAIGEILRPDPMSPSAIGFVWMAVGSIGVPPLSLFYAASIALLYQDATWERRLRPFAAVGRTALTNYLLQTVICTTLYNAWGFGLYGKVGPLLGLAPTAGIYAVQLAASAWWVRRFTFGPLEWLWRAVTYGRVERDGQPAVAGT